DVLGQLVITYLERRDKRLTGLVTVEANYPDSYTIVLAPENVDRIFLHRPNKAFGVADIDFAAVAQAKIFHLGYPPLLPRLIMNDGDELAAIFQQAKATGVVTSLDMAFPDPHGFSGQVNWPEIMRRTLPHVDVFLPSVEEIVFALRRADYDAWNADV